MSIFSRAWDVTQAKVNALLDRVEDPNQALDLSYEKMLSSLQEIKTHLADVVTEQKRIEKQIQKAQDEANQHQEEAEAAVKFGKDDLARAALEMKQKALSHAQALQQNLAQITPQVDQLKAAEQKFKARVESFRDDKEMAKAQYTAAKSVTQVNESLGGISKDLGGVGRAMQRSKDKTEEMQSRSEAVGELSKEGILNDPLETRSQTAQELDKLRTQQKVEDDLAALKSKVKN